MVQIRKRIDRAIGNLWEGKLDNPIYKSSHILRNDRSIYHLQRTTINV